MISIEFKASLSLVQVICIILRSLALYVNVEFLTLLIAIELSCAYLKQLWQWTCTIFVHWHLGDFFPFLCYSPHISNVK